MAEDGPSVSANYVPENALDDLLAIKHAEYLFINSYMVESEEYCDKVEPKKSVLCILPSAALANVSRPGRGCI